MASEYQLGTLHFQVHFLEDAPLGLGNHVVYDADDEDAKLRLNPPPS